MARTSLTGVVSGADQRLSAYAGLQALTTGPAWQVFEEDRKGSLAPGKLADLVVLSGDPTAIDPERLDTLRVVQTIKEDRVIYQAVPQSP